MRSHLVMVPHDPPASLLIVVEETGCQRRKPVRGKERVDMVLDRQQTTCPWLWGEPETHVGEGTMWVAEVCRQSLLYSDAVFFSPPLNVVTQMFKELSCCPGLHELWQVCYEAVLAIFVGMYQNVTEGFEIFPENLFDTFTLFQTAHLSFHQRIFVFPPSCSAARHQ